MPKLRAHNIAISLDGYMAGPNQSLEHGLGEGGEQLHTWYFAEDRTPVDQRYFDVSFEGIGANVMGRNMFGPIRGEWGDTDWKGWWGDDPPYHAPTFVLTHHARDPIEMQGGTTFHFVTDGIEAALERARAAAGGKAVKIAGGVSTVRQYLEAGVVDEIHLAISPMVLGRGEAMFAGIDLPALGFSVTERQATEAAMHVVLAK